MVRAKREVADQDLHIVETLAGLGSTLDEIALVLKVSASTLDRWLDRDEVRRAYSIGRAVARSRMASRLWDIAMSTDEVGRPTKASVTACIFWLKAQGGWSDRLKVEPVQADEAEQVVIYLPENGRQCA